MHAADADAGADVKHAWRRQREGPSRQRERPTYRRQRTQALIARDDIQPDAIPKPTRDSHAASLVGQATADRGVTAPAHAGMHAHRQTQMPAQTSNTRGGDSVRDRGNDDGAHAHP